MDSLVLVVVIVCAAYMIARAIRDARGPTPTPSLPPHCRHCGTAPCMNDGHTSAPHPDVAERRHDATALPMARTVCDALTPSSTHARCEPFPPSKWVTVLDARVRPAHVEADPYDHAALRIMQQETLRRRDRGE